MTIEDSKIVLALAIKLDNIAQAMHVMSENEMASITIGFTNPKPQLHFYKDQVLKFDNVEDMLLALMDSRIDEIKGMILKIVSIQS